MSIQIQGLYVREPNQMDEYKGSCLIFLVPKKFYLNEKHRAKLT